MNLCDPHRNTPHPVPSMREDQPPFLPVDCPRCGTTHNLHGDCLSKPTVGVVGPSPYPPLPPTGNFQFNELHISRLDVKVDGHTEHLFIAILNGSAVGQVIAKIQDWKACAVRMLYIMPVHRHKGVATRLFQAVEQFARREKATQLELGCLKANPSILDSQGQVYRRS